MLPIRWNHPPWRNIENSIVCALLSTPASNSWGWNSRAGMNAAACRNGSSRCPSDSSNRNTAAHATITVTLTSGVREDGIESRSGNIEPRL